MLVLSYLRLLRLPNLFIVAATQYLVYLHLIVPCFNQYKIKGSFEPFILILFILTTLAITGSGYIINDIFDFETDRINRPKKTIIPNEITLNKAYIFYFLMVISGGFIAFFISLIRVQFLFWFIYPITILALYVYSRWLKGVPLLGNILVSAFCAGVSGIFFLTEQSNFKKLQSFAPNHYSFIQNILLAYTFFAFLSNFYREIVKDLQDEEGDKISKIYTAAVAWGIHKTKTIAIVIALITAILIFYFFGIELSFRIESIFWLQLTLLQIPLIVSLYKLTKANNPSDFRMVGLWIKFLMLNGLLLLAYLTFKLYDESTFSAF